MATLLAFAVATAWWFVAGPLIFFALVGITDLIQRRHSVLRNYPVIGHGRFLLEEIRPEIRQYFVESNTEGRPYDRETRDLVYDRAKGFHGEEPFGTQRDVTAVGYEFVAHSLRAKPKPDGVLPVGPSGRAEVHPALRHRPAQRLGDELRLDVRQRDRGAQRGRRHGRVRARHRRGLDLASTTASTAAT